MSQQDDGSGPAGAASPLGAAGEEQAEQREFGRWLFSQECRFLTAAVKAEQLPELALVEVAFAGRSNVGKSSLVNALVGHKALARTSNTPGRTRQLNFFGLGGRLILVDLPGYGYARASKAEIESWTGLTRSYLQGRALLRRVCLLIDARHGLKDGDREIMSLLDQSAVSYQVVLTKADKSPAAALRDVLARTDAELARRPAAFPGIMVTSAVKGNGIADLRGSLAALAASLPKD